MEKNFCAEYMQYHGKRQVISTVLRHHTARAVEGNSLFYACCVLNSFSPNLYNVNANFTHSGSVLRFAEVIVDSKFCTLKLIFFLCLDIEL